MYMIDYWDVESQSQKQRPATAAEVAELDARKATAPQSVPETVSSLNAVLTLVRANKWQQLLDAVDQLPVPERLETQAFIQHANTWRRDHKLVQQMGPKIGLDSAGLDQFFTQAAALIP